MPALIPIAVFSLWYGASDGFRRFALSLNPRILTYVQSWRVIGLVFIILEARGVLPAIFALPAGYRDRSDGLLCRLEVGHPRSSQQLHPLASAGNGRPGNGRGAWDHRTPA